VWKRTIEGRDVHFRLVGINNQNFLMRDEETGTWWQQITGKAIFGPLKGEQLDAVLSDELLFGTWKQESPTGQVLLPVPKYAKEYETDWEPGVQKLPVPVSFPGTPLQSRDIVIGLQSSGASKAYPLTTLAAQSPIQDKVGGTPILLVIGPDGRSVRCFVRKLDGDEIELFRKSGGPWFLIDSAKGSEWDFQGCAVSGASKGKCLPRMNAIKDFWFDWRNYHPETVVYRR
jgi:hypothetical protein